MNKTVKYLGGTILVLSAAAVVGLYTLNQKPTFTGIKASATEVLLKQKLQELSDLDNTFKYGVVDCSDQGVVQCKVSNVEFTSFPNPQNLQIKSIFSAESVTLDNPDIIAKRQDIVKGELLMKDLFVPGYEGYFKLSVKGLKVNGSSPAQSTFSKLVKQTEISYGLESANKIKSFLNSELTSLDLSFESTSSVDKDNALKETFLLTASLPNFNTSVSLDSYVSKESIALLDSIAVDEQTFATYTQEQVLEHSKKTLSALNITNLKLNIEHSKKDFFKDLLFVITDIESQSAFTQEQFEDNLGLNLLSLKEGLTKSGMSPLLQSQINLKALNIAKGETSKITVDINNPSSIPLAQLIQIMSMSYAFQSYDQIAKSPLEVSIK